MGRGGKERVREDKDWKGEGGRKGWEGKGRRGEGK